MADSVRISQLELIDRLTIDDIIVVNNENVNTNSIKFSNVMNSIQEYPSLNFQGSVVFSGNVSLPATTVLNKALGDLTDVTLINPAADQLVRYNGVTWTNVNVSDLDFQMNIDSLLDVVLLNVEANQILVYNGAAWTNLDNPSYTKAESDAALAAKVAFTDISVVTAPGVDGGALTYNNTNGEFTFAPDSNVQAAKSVDVNTLVGVSAGETDLGDFNGTTITSNSSVKVALQELETALEASDGIVLTDLSVTVASASGQGNLTYNNANGEFTFTPADVYTAAQVDANFAPAAVLTDAALTGTPTAPTASSGTNSTQIATTAYADAAVAALDAAALRTLLGIKSGADAGGAGATSGELYFNTGSSTYVVAA